MEIPPNLHQKSNIFIFVVIIILFWLSQVPKKKASLVKAAKQTAGLFWLFISCEQRQLLNADVSF